MKAIFDIIFDNGGGITIQTEDYCHHYDDAFQAAEDYKALLDGEIFDEGNQPESRMEYDYATEFNGGYKWMDHNDIAEMEYLELGWVNINDFYKALNGDQNEILS